MCCTRAVLPPPCPSSVLADQKDHACFSPAAYAFILECANQARVRRAARLRVLHGLRKWLDRSRGGPGGKEGEAGGGKKKGKAGGGGGGGEPGSVLEPLPEGLEALALADEAAVLVRAQWPRAQHVRAVPGTSLADPSVPPCAAAARRGVRGRGPDRAGAPRRGRALPALLRLRGRRRAVAAGLARAAGLPGRRAQRRAARGAAGGHA
jgi:hypothetical protein